MVSSSSPRPTTSTWRTWNSRWKCSPCILLWNRSCGASLAFVLPRLSCWPNCTTRYVYNLAPDWEKNTLNSACVRIPVGVHKCILTSPHRVRLGCMLSYNLKNPMYSEFQMDPSSVSITDQMLYKLLTIKVCLTGMNKYIIHLRFPCCYLL